ncbi:glycosyltransferase, partial [Nanoarchaeota archaeon]
AAALNKALAIIKGKFFACLDADSVVESGTLKKMLGVYEDNNEDLAIVTPAMKVKEPRTVMQRLQRLEYILTLFAARLMSCLDCLYVAPGPFSLYRTKIIKELGGFDEGNLTEDMEIAYRVQQHHYYIKHCHDAYVYTNTPKSTKELYAQRNRWFKGGISNALKYRKITFNKDYGDFGFIQMSINFIAFMLCASAIFFFSYYMLIPLVKGAQRLYLVNFDLIPYIQSFKLTFDPLSITDVGFIVLFIFVIAFGMFYLSHKSAKESLFKRGFLYIIPYFLIYYIILSFIALVAVFEFMWGKKQKW